jgi:HEAT repeat protein
MKTKPILVALTVAIALTATSAALAAEAPPGVAALVAKMPSASIAGGQQVAADLIKLGAPGVKALAGMVLAPGTGDDSKARFALSGLALYVARPDAEAQRAMVAGALVEALQAADQPGVKSFLINMLQLAGKDEAVAPLAKFLADAGLCEPAAQALVRIGSPSASAALVQALPGAKGAQRVTIIRALGDLGAKAATSAILPYAADADTETRRVALYALANIGDSSATDALAKAAAAEGTWERAHATALYLKFATRLAEAGDKQACANICRGLIRTRIAPRENNVVADALRTLALAVGADAADDVMAATLSANKQLRAAALELIQTMPGEKVTSALAEKMKQAPAQEKADILRALARRGDAKAAAAALDALKDDEKTVRLAAIEVAARSGTPQATAAILAILASDQADEVKAAQDALGRITSDEAGAAMARALPKLPAASRAAVLPILGKRGGKEPLDAILAAAADQDRQVRLAAIKALGEKPAAEALARLVDVLLKSQDNDERAECERAVLRISGRAGGAGEPILAAMPNATGANRAVLLKALAMVAGPKALEAVLADTRAADPALQEAAVRALADWRIAGKEALDALLAVARTSDKPALQVLAIRGYVRLAGLPGDSSAAARVALYKDALGAARRPEEKRLVLAALAEVRDIEALKLVETCFSDDAVAADACMAAVKIVIPQKEKQEPLVGPAVMEAMKKAAAAAKDQNVRNQALNYVNATPKPDGLNAARGRPVTASVGTQGAQKPELAVDGNAADLNSSWWGSRWPATFQVDLQKPAMIDSIRVWFYWGGGRYYQYTVSVSPDGKTWKMVGDMSKTTAPTTPAGQAFAFDPVEARFVKIDILKNSINEAVHLVEVKVYAVAK